MVVLEYVIYKEENEFPDLADNLFDTEWFKNWTPKMSLNYKFCLFRQQLEFLLVGQCPSLAVCFPMPWNGSVHSLKPAAHSYPGRCSLLQAGAAKGL